MNREALARALAKLDIIQEQDSLFSYAHARAEMRVSLDDDEHHALWQARHPNEEIVGTALNSAKEGEIVAVNLGADPQPRTVELSTIRRTSFRLPSEMYRRWQEGNLPILVGGTARMSLFGEEERDVRIVSAEPYEDQMLGPGLWVSVELLP